MNIEQYLNIKAGGPGSGPNAPCPQCGPGKAGHGAEGPVTGRGWFPEEKSNFAGRYFKVKKPFVVNELVGYQPSNYYYGASQIHRPVAGHLKLKKGEEIHKLPGGWVAHTKDGKIHPLIHQTSLDRNPFEHDHSIGYGGTISHIPSTEHVEETKTGKKYDYNKVTFK